MSIIFILLSIAIIFMYLRLSNINLLNLKSLFLGLIILLYLVIPILDYTYFNRNVSDLYYIIVFVAIVFILLGFILSKEIKVLSVKKKIIFPSSKENNFLLFISLFSFFTLYMYVSSFGGFTNAIVQGSILRYSPGTGGIVLGGDSLLLYFIAFSKIVGIVSFYKIINIPNLSREKVKLIILFTVNSLIIFTFGIISASRGALVMYILLLFYVYIYNYRAKCKRPVFKLFILFILLTIMVSFFINYGKKFIGHAGDYFENKDYGFTIERYEKSTDEKVARFIAEFSHVYKSLNLQIEREVTYTYFQHFLTAPVNSIPIKLLGLDKKPARITEYNTLQLTGQAVGGKPPGIFASFWYSGGFFALIISVFIYGTLLSYLEVLLERLVYYNSFLKPYVLYIYFTVPWHSMNGDPAIIIKKSIYLVVFFLLLILATLRFTNHKNTRCSGLTNLDTKIAL
jgi:hypothetical protein